MKFLKAIAVFLWLCALVLSATVVFGTYVPRKDSTPQEPSYSNAAAGAYNGLSKLVWGIVLSWTTFACVKGFGGERIDRERPNLKSYHFYISLDKKNVLRCTYLTIQNGQIMAK